MSFRISLAHNRPLTPQAGTGEEGVERGMAGGVESGVAGVEEGVQRGVADGARKEAVRHTESFSQAVLARVWVLLLQTEQKLKVLANY
jgi:hypothetical protein